MHVKKHFSFLTVFGALSTLMLLLSACGAPANVPTQAPPESPTDPVVTQASTQTPAEQPGQDSPSVSIDVSAVARDITSQVIDVVPDSTDHPWWEVMPQYTLLTLEGYPISDHLMKAQIFVYPVEGLVVNETASEIPGNLQSLLQSQGTGELLPYLPPYNAAQVMHAQVGYLDFKNGKGVRYLTQFDQSVMPINNYELHYTFQGLTNDGKYYVAAVLPVNLPGLPADGNVDLDNLPQDFMEDFPTYMIDTVDMLNGQPPSAFTPDLSILDAVMASLEVN